jgi:hypothetical protein
MLLKLCCDVYHQKVMVLHCHDEKMSCVSVCFGCSCILQILKQTPPFVYIGLVETGLSYLPQVVFLF